MRGKHPEGDHGDEELHPRTGLGHFEQAVGHHATFDQGHGLGLVGRDAQGEWLPWQLVYPRRARRLWHLVHNADVNLALSHQNLVDHLAADINDLPEGADVRECVSYQLVARLARTALPPAIAAYQFELRLESPRGEAPECMLQSPVLAA